MKKIYFTLFYFMPILLFAQVGIGIERPEADLDVNTRIKFSTLPIITEDVTDYDRYLFVDNSGNVSYRTFSTNSYLYRTSYFDKMIRPFSIGNVPMLLSPLSKQIEIPANGRSLIEINYSIPNIGLNSGNASVFLRKSIKGGETIDLYETTRSFTVVRGYAAGAGSLGRAISNVYYETIENTSNTTMYITYSVYGVNSANSSTFGMRNATSVNYNWGRGSMNINVFDY